MPVVSTVYTVLMLIVTGANGKLGRLVVESLLSRVPATQIGASVRDPSAAADLTARGVRVRRGDFAEPATLAAAFEGASQVLIISSNSSGPEAVRHHRGAIDAARAAGAQRILYTSHLGVSPTSAFKPMPDHAATEAALRESGVPYTSLRNGFYATTVPLLLGGARATGELAAPADGPVSWTGHRDLADAAAIVMCDADRAGSETLNLTAAEALDLEAIAALFSQVAGRTVRRVVISDADYRAGMIAHGVPADRAELMVGMFEASRAGEFARVDSTLAKMLGRAPQPVRHVLA